MNPANSTSLTYIDKNRLSPSKITELAVIGVLLAGLYAFFGTFEHLWMDWNSPSIDRTYNMLIPLFSLIFVWLKWRRIRTMPIRASFWGLPLLLFGLGMRLMAEPGQVKFVNYASLVFMLGGVVWMVFGTRMFKELLFPIVFLLLMTPPPDPLYQRMSVPMMDLAAKAGFTVTRLIGVDAALSGRRLTIMAAGALKQDLPLNVAEACSGMKSLFALAAIAIAFAYITRKDLLTRIIISLSAVPIAIAMNTLRVGLIGLLVVKFGPEASGGVIHWTEGAVNYIVEIALLFGVGYVVSWAFGKPAVEWGRAEAPSANPGGNQYPYSTRISAQAIVCVVLLVLAFPALYFYHENVKYLSAGLEPRIPLENFASAKKDIYGDGAVGTYFHMLGEDKRIGMDLDLATTDTQYVGYEQEVSNEVLKAAEVDAYINIGYFECPRDVNVDDLEIQRGNYVLGYVAFHKSASDGINRGAIHYPDQCYPGAGLATASSGDVVTVPTPGYCGGETQMARSIFYDDKGMWVLVYYHMNNNGRYVVDRSTGKIENYVKTLLGQRAGFLAQVQFYTVIGQGEPRPGGILEEKIKQADERMRKFCPLFLEKLGRYLPEPVK
jgi:exosortase